MQQILHTLDSLICSIDEIVNFWIVSHNLNEHSFIVCVNIWKYNSYYYSIKNSDFPTI